MKKKIKRNVLGYTGCFHFWTRAKERGITYDMISDAIKFGKIHAADKGRKMFKHKDIYIIFSDRDKLLITINSWAESYNSVKMLSENLKNKLINNIKETETIIRKNRFKNSKQIFKDNPPDLEEAA